VHERPESSGLKVHHPLILNPRFPRRLPILHHQLWCPHPLRSSMSFGTPVFITHPAFSGVIYLFYISDLFKVFPCFIREPVIFLPRIERFPTVPAPDNLTEGGAFSPAFSQSILACAHPLIAERAYDKPAWLQRITISILAACIYKI
jgi:hypothetical protein